MYRYRRQFNRPGPPEKDSETVLGINGNGDPVSIDREDLSGHFLICGKTGTGKTNLLRLLLGSLDASDSNIILFDPHGQLSEWSIGNLHNRDVVFLSGRSYPGCNNKYTGINVIESMNSEEAAILSSSWMREVLSSEDALSHGTWGPRLEVIFGPVLIECIKVLNDLTLHEFQSLISDRTKLIEIIEKSGKKELVNYLKSQSGDRKAWMDLVASAMNKLLPVLESSFSRNLLSSHINGNLNLDEILATYKSLIVPDLNESITGVSGYKIASVLLLARIWSSLLRKGVEKRKTYVVIDEAHLFPEKILTTLLSEGRKYGIVLILSYQYLTQISGGGLASLFGNIRNISVFNLSRDDSRLISENIVEIKRRDSLSDKILLQDFHSCLFYSKNSGGETGPLTIIPRYIEEHVDPDIILLKKRESILKYGKTEAIMTQTLPAEMTIHETMITDLKEYLERKGLSCKTGTKYSDVIPDMVTEIGLNRIFFEVEESDIRNIMRIAKKIFDYNGERVAFVSQSENRDRLLAAIIRIYQGINRLSASLSMKQSSKSEDFTSIWNLLLISYENGKFEFFNGKEYVNFLPRHLTSKGSLDLRVSKLPYPDIRKQIITNIIEKGPEGDISGMEAIIGKYDRYTMERLRESLVKSGFKKMDIASLLNMRAASFNEKSSPK
jgi:hypothetical protein